jgi:hypothetical protein
MYPRLNKMKKLLSEGRPIYSCTIGTPHPNLSEIAGLSGYECIMLDGEHGTFWPLCQQYAPDPHWPRYCSLCNSRRP